jgi:phosphatidylglycerol:prolipoprotein diacylglycerol transferase
VKVQPTPIYETVAMALLAYALWRMRDRVRPGVVFAAYLLGSGLERFLVEFIRRNHEVLAGLTAPQLESMALLLAGLAWLAMLVRRGGFGALLPAPG